MHSPAPNILGAISLFTASPFTEYMKELKTFLSDIHELVEILDVKFDSLIHALGIGGTALAGTAAPLQGGEKAILIFFCSVSAADQVC